MRNRFHTKLQRAACDMNFMSKNVFEFDWTDGNAKLDSSKLLKMNQPIHLTIFRHRGRSDKQPEVLGTKYVDWRSALFCNSVEINAEIMPSDLTDRTSIGIIQLNLDLIPRMTKSQLQAEDEVQDQIKSESKALKQIH